MHALAGSQLSTDKGVSALLTNWRNETPLVLIVGNKCLSAPVKRFLERGNSRVQFLIDIVLWIGSGYLMLGSAKLLG